MADRLNILGATIPYRAKVSSPLLNPISISTTAPNALEAPAELRQNQQQHPVRLSADRYFYAGATGEQSFAAVREHTVNGIESKHPKHSTGFKAPTLSIALQVNTASRILQHEKRSPEYSPKNPSWGPSVNYHLPITHRYPSITAAPLLDPASGFPPDAQSSALSSLSTAALSPPGTAPGIPNSTSGESSSEMNWTPVNDMPGAAGSGDSAKQRRKRRISATEPEVFEVESPPRSHKKGRRWGKKQRMLHKKDGN